MSEAIPFEWREPAKNAARCLTIAKFLAARLYPDDDEPEALVPALVIALALFHSSDTTKNPAPDEQATDEAES